MFRLPVPFTELDRPFRSRNAGTLATEPKDQEKSPKAAAPSAHEGDSALRLEAALRAADHDNIDGGIPVVREHMEIVPIEQAPKPASTMASAEQSLRDQLLGNDSLGG